MKIKLLTRSSDLNKILLAKLNQIGLTGEIIDYKNPLLPQLEDAEVIVNGFGNIDKSMIDACPNLELVQQTGIGIDNVDVSYCTSKSILVANVPLANAVSVAEHTIFLILYLAKNMKESNSDNNRSGLLERRVPGILGSEVQGKVLVIIGLGATGLEVAKRAKSFGMHVIAVTKNPLLKKPGIDKVYFVDNLGGSEILSESLSRADYVSLHTPLTEETKNMIGTKELSLMKKSAFLVNVSRAAIVDREALFSVLSNSKISGAAFDVFWEEPPDTTDKLLKLHNFILTPHIAGWTFESVDAIARIISNNIERFAQAQVPLTIVNPELAY
ncbi:MAG TPA: NAD(P)-dependent oxidoreductase [Nitrososphaeraceae archaeon]|jgi:D-3-phosphoglycerate dehydrogenase / 2-oxoglutarate reductase|nr:NAD(P)-dependent oxidoreductase [Nitrososphaeraceae archaeon]